MSEPIRFAGDDVIVILIGLYVIPCSPLYEGELVSCNILAVGVGLASPKLVFPLLTVV